MQRECTLKAVRVFLSIHRCGPALKCASSLGWGSHSRLHPSEVRRPMFAPGITLPHQRPARQTHCITTTQGKASFTDECGWWTVQHRSRGFMVCPSFLWCSSLWGSVLTQMGHVNRTGVKPCGRSILMEHPSQWIRLMLAHERGVAVQPFWQEVMD